MKRGNKLLVCDFNKHGKQAQENNDEKNLQNS